MSCASKTRASNSCWAKPSWRRQRCESWQRETSKSGAVVGLLLVAFAPHHLFAVAGIALWGIGSALGFSLGISALSVDPVMTPARVSVLSTVNYGAALIGPPLLGLIADHIGYHRALAFVALPVLLAIVLDGQVPDRRGTRRTDLVFGD